MFSARRHHSDYRIRRSLRLMRCDFAEHMDIKTVARELGLSPQHFFQLFKRYVGVTPNVYWNTLRSEQAICDLLTTEKSVTDIGYNLGFHPKQVLPGFLPQTSAFLRANIGAERIFIDRFRLGRFAATDITRLSLVIDHANHDENLVVLLFAALDRRHCCSGRDGKGIL